MTNNRFIRKLRKVLGISLGTLGATNCIMDTVQGVEQQYPLNQEEETINNDLYEFAIDSMKDKLFDKV